MAISFNLKSKFKKYSQRFLRNGMTGKEVAEKMLHDNGIYDVKVVSTQGFLTDHYDPRTKTVNLSSAVYGESSISAAAVAAHECGHAVQHANAYTWLTLRSKMVPFVQVSSMILQFLIFALMFGAYRAPAMGNTFLLIYIIVQSAITLFSIVTLPVEVDASKRALIWLDKAGITYGEGSENAKDALKWAAYTYFGSALAAIATLIYLIMQFAGRSRD